MQLISQWKKWHRRYSVHIVSLMPVIATARDQVPQIREFLPPAVYSAVMVGLFVVFLVALNVKQESLSQEASNGPDKTV